MGCSPHVGSVRFMCAYGPRELPALAKRDYNHEVREL
jgi:hypothetical protein